MMPFGNYLQCPSKDCSTRNLQEDSGPQVPATHEYAALTFETLQQSSQLLSSLTPIHFQSQGFSSKQCWLEAAANTS